MERDKGVSYTTIPGGLAAVACRVRTCGLSATEEHHVVPKHFTRSWKERDYALLYGEVVPVKVPLCAAHHQACTENQAMFEYTPGEGFVFWTELGTSVCDECGGEQPGCPCQLESGLTEGESEDGRSLLPRRGRPSMVGTQPAPDSPSVSPGQACPTCQRRIPYPKLASSPTSAVWSMRLPADAKEDFRGIVDALAGHLGAGEERYGAYKAMLTAAVWALQVAPERVLSEIGERVA